MLEGYLCNMADSQNEDRQEPIEEFLNLKSWDLPETILNVRHFFNMEVLAKNDYDFIT